MGILIFLLCIIVVTYFVCFFRLGLLVESIAVAILLTALTIYYQFNLAVVMVDVITCAFLILINIRFIRRKLFTNAIFSLAKKSIPALSASELEALTAGTVSFEGELFSGAPRFDEFLAKRPATLSAEEQAFLDGPTETLCQMLDDWQISRDGDLPPAVWQYIKDQGFLGIIIPKKYGGKEFSASMHAAIIIKLGSRDLVAAISVAVPNSLGPAELLLKYGTQEQKDFYLPRLARGEDIPCFALTGPHAGSDAASIPDYGIVCYGNFEGKKTLGIRLNWDKRYITLAPIATIIGLAFRLRDPDHFLSSTEDRGITCALIPRHLPGIDIGQRHIPFDIHFQNGPITGTDVFIPLDYIIGGRDKIGQGWQMLMECLSVGRAITLPSAGSGTAMVAALASGCYARVRHQFGIAIGRFEGVQEMLARIGTNAYLNRAALDFVSARIDEGEEPSVLSAIVKYHTTERCRQAVNDAMDIHGGKAICLGPRNYMANLYRCAPINITVEGANVLTRNLIIFGQGAIRCHPYLLKEMEAISQSDAIVFDKLLCAHIGFTLNNLARASFHSFTCSLFARAPRGATKKHFKNIARYARVFALTADVISTTMGASLKRKERISARLGDVLSLLFLASASLKRFHDEREPAEDIPIINYLCASIFHEIEERLITIYNNLPNRFLGFILKIICLPWGVTKRQPSDLLSEQVAQLLLSPTAPLLRLTQGIYKYGEDSFLEQLQKAQQMTVELGPLEKKIRDARKQERIYALHEDELIKKALAINIIDEQEAKRLLELVTLRAEIIAVDAFSTFAEYVGHE